MYILWNILIGFLAGLVARLLSPGPNNPRGFILTTILGILGAVAATWLGQLVGWYEPGERAGFIGAIIGAIILLAVWHFATRNDIARR